MPRSKTSTKLPRGATNTSAPLNHLLSLIPTLHKRFARYDAVDEAKRDEFEKQIR